MSKEAYASVKRHADNGTERARTGRALLASKQAYASVKRGLY